jgi:hypothetical protein
MIDLLSIIRCAIVKCLVIFCLGLKLNDMFIFGFPYKIGILAS